MPSAVRDNPQLRRFELDADGHVAFSQYQRSDDTITFMHTEVPKALEGRGIGSALTRELVCDACAAGIAEVTALVRGDNPAAPAILQRALGQVEVRFEGSEMLVRAPLPAVC